ncbi:MAG: hypothetical protein ACM3MG_03735 [Bacillota bacterium]
MLRNFKALIIFVALVGVCEISQAETTVRQSTTTTTTTKKERKATLNFEDELVEGGTQKPELFYLFQKKNFNYKRLIKLRENFLPEMRRSAEDIQRVRGAS